MLDMLLLGLFGAAILGAAVIGNDNDDHDTPIDPDQPTEGDDVLNLGEDATGLIDALDGDDQIRVTAETGQTLIDDPRGPEWLTDDSAAPLMVDGGTGNDVLHLSGDGYQVTGGEGADRIELGDATNIWVEAGAGDTVVGGSGHGYIHLTEDAVYQGSASAEQVLMDSSGTADMGAGDDRVWGGETASRVLGGDGDDRLDGTSKLFYSGGTASLGDYISHDADTLDGGAGNDTIIASHGDVVSLGAGLDRLEVFLEVRQDASPVQITDFNPDADSQITINYGSYGTDGAWSPAPLVGEISLTEVNGNTIITGSNGQTLAVLTGATGLVVGLYQEGGDPILSDIDGNYLLFAADCDVIIERFYDVRS
jgi:Ca2+-binding RTX toxin-like protein